MMAQPTKVVNGEGLGSTGHIGWYLPISSGSRGHNQGHSIRQAVADKEDFYPSFHNVTLANNNYK